MEKLDALERSAKWNADELEFITVACTEDILAIADYVRELEQRAEAAEALNNHMELAVRKAEGVSEAMRRKVETAEAKLAEQ